eukprot:471724-Pleurochrysis_carterae.AAC.2
MHWSKKMRPTPVIDARFVMSSCVDMSTCSALSSMAKREDRPRDTGDSKMKPPPCLWAAIATRTQFLRIAFARMTVAGKPPSFCGTPIGCSVVQST